jgi:hypothetical protein
MVCAHCGSESHYTGDSTCAKYTARYAVYNAKNLGIDKTSKVQSPRVQQVRNIRTLSIRMYSSRMQRIKQHELEVLTKTPGASRASVLNTSAPIAKARSNQRATTEGTALEWKVATGNRDMRRMC